MVVLLLLGVVLLLLLLARVAGVYTRLPRCTWKRCRLLCTLSQLARCCPVSLSMLRTESLRFGACSAPARTGDKGDAVVLVLPGVVALLVAAVVLLLAVVVAVLVVVGFVASDSRDNRRRLAAKRS